MIDVQFQFFTDGQYAMTLLMRMDHAEELLLIYLGGTYSAMAVFEKIADKHKSWHS